MNLITRSQWGARAPKSTPSQMKGSEGTFKHHTTGETLGNPDTGAWVRSIQNYHMDSKDWNDIAYSFLIAANGDVYEGRGWNVVGAHTLNHNSTSHGFAYLGNGDKPIPDAAWASIVELTEEHDRRYGKGFSKGHRDVGATHCPGDALYALVHGSAPAPAPTPQPTPQPTPTPAPNHPNFPLPRDHWFGPISPNPKNHSGFYPADRPGVSQIRNRLIERGWRGVAKGDRYDAALANTIKQFQAEKHLAADGLTGPLTWDALWNMPVT